MFREYDLRGQVNDEQLNEYTVGIIAQAYGTMLRRRNIDTAVVGYDYRPSSEWITEATIQGLTATGINVINLGMALTPMMYSAQYHYQAEGGVMVTASHNPTGWSGFKLALGYSHTLGPVEMNELYQLTASEDFAAGSGVVRSEDFFDAYLADVIKRVDIARPVRAVVNTGNGTPGPIVTKVLRAAGCEVVELYTDLDWSFPHYYPNPALVDMMNDTGAKVIDFDVKCSQSLPEDIEAHGGVPVMWKTGHSYIKQKLWEVNSPLAGEMSGHIFFGEPDYHGFDDAVFTALKLAEYLSQREQPMSAIIEETPYYVSTPALQARCPADLDKYAESVKYEVVAKLTDEFKADGYDVIDINGARVNFGDGWGLVRASSNLPVLVLRFEAKTEERKEELMALFREKFARHPEIGAEWESG
ncbi:MAG: hypothetical protein B6I35_11425 [Anaerolineaceae bacterium 4572_32.2]|nr:MAG: hypothetical protein B6I35_11425 [Anaerolineaceae bacterium 4572_32.2]